MRYDKTITFYSLVGTDQFAAVCAWYSLIMYLSY